MNARLGAFRLLLLLLWYIIKAVIIIGFILYFCMPLVLHWLQVILDFWKIRR